MIDNKQLISIFCNAAFIVPPSPDGADEGSVFLGFIQVLDCDEAFDKVVKAYCNVVDNMLASLRMTDLQWLRTIFLRPFSFDEFLLLYDKTIRPTDFTRYPIFSTLRITSEDDRRLFTHLRPERHEYHNRLAAHIRVYNPLLYQFLYGIHHSGTDK